MEQCITIKSYPHGIALYMKEDSSFDVILEQIRDKFTASKAFFGNAAVSLALDGAVLSSEQEMQVIEVIQECTDLQIIALVGKDEETTLLFEDINDIYENDQNRIADIVDADNAMLYYGTIKRDEFLEAEESIVVIGDVNPGAQVFSDRDVIVLGALLGDVEAGLDGQPGHFVAALELQPQNLIINDISNQKKTDKKFWPDSNKKSPKIAYIKDDAICIAPITKELLGKIILEK